MFGHQDDISMQPQAVADLTTGPVDEEPAINLPTANPAPADDQAVANNQNWQHPGAPIDPAQPVAPTAPTTLADADLPAVTPKNDNQPNAANDLIDIKQRALSELSPLVNHLDQSPEDKFRTMLMMIQASDDQSLIKSAYETAQSISNEKARAKALLDIINEINYFTQNSTDKK